MCEEGGLCVSVNLASRLHLRHHRCRYVEEIEKFLVPFKGMDVEKNGA
jgi:hypothetical protein